MAPNLKRRSALSQSLADLPVIRPKDVVPVHNSDDYWEWPTPKLDMFSADHIVENLLRASAVKQPEDATLPCSDQYWAELQPVDTDRYEQSDDAEQSEASPACHGPETYWDEATHQASDAYWAERNHATDNASYWQWDHQPTAVDAYWSW